MQALVEAALRQVINKVEVIDAYISATDKQEKIAKAINSVDALKSALKAM